MLFALFCWRLRQRRPPTRPTRKQIAKLYRPSSSPNSPKWIRRISATALMRSTKRCASSGRKSCNFRPTKLRSTKVMRSGTSPSPTASITPIVLTTRAKASGRLIRASSAETGQVETLEGAINRCRVENGEKPLDPMTGLMASLSAVMSESSRGKPFAIAIPDDPRALAAYDRGKEFFYSRKGQLGVSCASCHMSPAGERMRGDILAPALGILAAMPIYRSDWGSMGTIDPSHLHLLVADPRGSAEGRRRGLSRCRIFPLLHEQRHSCRRSGDTSMKRS